MNKPATIVWGVLADEAGHVLQTSVSGEELPGGGLRVWQREQYFVEPAGAYATVHPAPMPMKWHHGEEIGRVVVLRKAHGRLLAVAECELKPDDLAGLTEKFGDLRWSTSTENRRKDPLNIVEISLTPSPASVGLPAVKWIEFGITRGGNPPMWVREELQRADKTSLRHRKELRVHDVDYERNPYSDFDRYEAEIGFLRGGEFKGQTMNIGGERVPMEFRPGKILSVGGRRFGVELGDDGGT